MTIILIIFRFIRLIIYYFSYNMILNDQLIIISIINSIYNIFSY